MTLAFSKDQRDDLERLGVAKLQIVELEKILPGCRFAETHKSPRLNDVRHELDTVLAAIKGATKKMSRLARPPKSRSPDFQVFEALEHVYQASIELRLGSSLGQISAAVDALEILARVVAKARDDLSPEQRRDEASPTPIRLIHDALVLGWAKHARALPGRTPPFPKTMAPALSHGNSGRTSVFSAIVDICYEAACPKLAGKSHERAIKLYLKLQKTEATRLSQQRREAGIVADSR